MCLMCNTLYAASKLIKEEENKSSKRCRVKPDIKLHSACSEIGPLAAVTKQVWVGIDEPGRKWHQLQSCNMLHLYFLEGHYN